jgi:hypothetical protein
MTQAPFCLEDWDFHGERLYFFTQVGFLPKLFMEIRAGSSSSQILVTLRSLCWFSRTPAPRSLSTCSSNIQRWFFMRVGPGDTLWHPCHPLEFLLAWDHQRPAPCLLPLIPSKSGRVSWRFGKSEVIDGVSGGGGAPSALWWDFPIGNITVKWGWGKV